MIIAIKVWLVATLLGTTFTGWSELDKSPFPAVFAIAKTVCIMAELVIVLAIWEKL